MRRRLLILWLVAGCYRAVTPTAPDERKPLDDSHALVEHPRRPPTVPMATSGAYVVAGCNTACTDCALHGGTYVIGTLARTGQHLFPNPNPPGPPGNAYACNAAVDIGERVTLVAHTTESVRL